MSYLTKHLNLQQLILTLASLSALVMLFNTTAASYQVQRKQLVDNTLESNRVYASKLAQTTQYFISESKQQLAYSAAHLGQHANDIRMQQVEVERLKRQSNSFSSVVVIDSSGVVRATAPDMPTLQGTRLTSASNKLALELQSPLISSPFVAPTGNLIVTISHPIFDKNGSYSGYLTASVHLEEQNVLHSLLGTHFYRDGSYLCVVGRDGTLLYHPERERIGESAIRNVAVQAVIQGRAGALQATNSHGIQMLAGFAPVPEVGWGIVAQRPLASTLAPLGGLVSNVMWKAAPLSILSLVLIWFFSRRIATPLWQLARAAQPTDVADSISRTRAINAWYFEAAQLKSAVLISFQDLNDRIGKLDLAALTDPLTRIYNRRGLERSLSELGLSGMEFGVITIDVDHFKSINDRFGHEVGDLVIAEVARRMRGNARPEDILCRHGGEEFIILLPGTDSIDTVKVAERLRNAIADHQFPVAGRVTISAGASHFPETEIDADLVIRQADKALYSAKRAGRNQVILYRKHGQSKE